MYAMYGSNYNLLKPDFSLFERSSLPLLFVTLPGLHVYKYKPDMQEASWLPDIHSLEQDYHLTNNVQITLSGGEIFISSTLRAFHSIP